MHKLLYTLLFALCGLVAAKDAQSSYALPISQKGYELIIKYEVSSRYYYERFLMRPTVPAWQTTRSGVTVGFGCDLGHTSKAQIRRDWQGNCTPSP